MLRSATIVVVLLATLGLVALITILWCNVLQAAFQRYARSVQQAGTAGDSTNSGPAEAPATAAAVPAVPVVAAVPLATVPVVVDV
jgi:hypothetical protein